MPPHCDSMDGPVVTAAKVALESEDVDLILPYVFKEGEAELRDAFELAVKARTQEPESKIVADRFFFETAVRIHRAGEGAAYTGLKPAGLDVGPVIPIAERAIGKGSPALLIDFFVKEVRAEIRERFDDMLRARAGADEGVDAVRAHVEATLGLQVWANGLFRHLTQPARKGMSESREHDVPVREIEEPEAFVPRHDGWAKLDIEC